MTTASESFRIIESYLDSNGIYEFISKLPPQAASRCWTSLSDASMVSTWIILVVNYLFCEVNHSFAQGSFCFPAMPVPFPSKILPSPVTLNTMCMPMTPQSLSPALTFPLSPRFLLYKVVYSTSPQSISNLTEIKQNINLTHFLPVKLLLLLDSLPNSLFFSILRSRQKSRINSWFFSFFHQHISKSFWLCL